MVSGRGSVGGGPPTHQRLLEAASVGYRRLFLPCSKRQPAAGRPEAPAARTSVVSPRPCLSQRPL